MSETALGKLFYTYGQVKRVHLITDYYTRQSKCFGYVEMVNNEEAFSAIRLLNGTMVDNRCLVVKESRTRDQRRSSLW